MFCAWFWATERRRIYGVFKANGFVFANEPFGVADNFNRLGICVPGSASHRLVIEYDSAFGVLLCVGYGWSFYFFAPFQVDGKDGDGSSGHRA